MAGFNLITEAMGFAEINQLHGHGSTFIRAMVRKGD